MADLQDTGRSPDALTFIQCDASCIEGKHDFQGWREFEDGLGGETVCAKCGMGALEYTLKLGV